MEKNTVICIGYVPKELNLTVDVDGGTYNTPASRYNTTNLDLTFTNGVTIAFSSMSSAILSNGMSKPTKEGYHLYGEESTDEAYATKMGLQKTPWILVDNATGKVINVNNAAATNGTSTNAYAYDGMSTVDVTVQANWIPNTYNLTIDPNGGTLYGQVNGVASILGNSKVTRTYTYDTDFQFCSTTRHQATDNGSLKITSTNVTNPDTGEAFCNAL